MTNTQKPTTLYTASELEQIDEDELVNRFQNGDIEAFNPSFSNMKRKYITSFTSRFVIEKQQKILAKRCF